MCRVSKATCSAFMGVHLLPHCGEEITSPLQYTGSLEPCACTSCRSYVPGSWWRLDRLRGQGHHFSATLGLPGSYITTDCLKVVVKAFGIGISELTDLVNVRTPGITLKP